MLSSTSQGVAEIAAAVGYESEPAFNRAFKRAFGAPPARFRRQSRAVPAAKPAPVTRAAKREPRRAAPKRTAARRRK